MLTLHWVKSTADSWLPLEDLDLNGVVVGGVYIIWYAGSPPGVIKVGHGDIVGQLKAQKADLGTLMYGKKGLLYVTWASVPADQRKGVVHYLADQYRPIIGDIFVRAEPIPVNLLV
jgi:hypothetical protein